MLSIFKRKHGYWHIRGTVTDGDRVVKVRRTTGTKSRKQAEAVARHVEQTILNQMTGRATALPFRLAAEAWLKVKPRSETCTLNCNELVSHYGNTFCDEINRDEWDAFVALNLYGNAASYINRKRSTLVSILHKAGRTGLNIPKHKEGDTRVRFLTFEEQERLLAEYPEYLRGMFTIMCYQGLRISEAVNLQPHHVNLEARKMTIKGKWGKVRILPIHQRAWDVLNDALPTNKQYIFYNSKGERYEDSRNVRGVHRRACKRAGIIDFTLHDWRHHWASRLIMAGANIKSLKKLGGWESITMVERYADVSDEHTEDTLMRMQ